MRKLTFLLLALWSLPLFASTYGTVIVRDGDHNFVDGDLDTAEISDLGRHYAYFEREGAAYVIRDADTLARIRKILRPQVDLGSQQAKLGNEQAALGAKQAALGARQAALGAKQAVAGSGPKARELAADQRELERQQRHLADQQRPLADQQRVLADKQRAAAREARRQLEKLFDDAVRTGSAQRRRK